MAEAWSVERRIRTNASFDVILPRNTMADREADAILGVLNGDIERFAELVDAYQEPAIRIAFTFLGNHEEARDAAQEAFIRAYQALGSFKQKSKFSTWLYRIVVNICKDAYRRKAHQPKIAARVGSGDSSDEQEGIFIDVDDPAAGPVEVIANQELSRKLTGAISRLPKKQQQAFMLHHLHGLPLDEVAVIMNCRLGTVKSHVFRAMEHLRQSLGSLAQQEGR